jgi:hypothetical protein
MTHSVNRLRLYNFVTHFVSGQNTKVCVCVCVFVCVCVCVVWYVCVCFCVCGVCVRFCVCGMCVFVCVVRVCLCLVCVCVCVFVCMCVCVCVCVCVPWYWYYKAVMLRTPAKCHTYCAHVLTGAMLGTCTAETIFMKASVFHQLVYIRILACNMYIMKPSQTGLLSFHTTWRQN